MSSCGWFPGLFFVHSVSLSLSLNSPPFLHLSLSLSLSACVSKQLDKIRSEQALEVSKLNEVISALELSKRKLEINASNLAEELNSIKGRIDSPPPHASYPKSGYAPLLLQDRSGNVKRRFQEEEMDSVSSASTLVTLPVKKKAKARTKNQRPSPPTRRGHQRRGFGSVNNSVCSICSLGKFGLMITCKPTGGTPCPNNCHAHAGCVVEKMGEGKTFRCGQPCV